MLELVKLALRIKTAAFDAELNMLIEAAKADLGIAGVILPEELNAICQRAIVTYCLLNFGSGPDDPDRVKASYDEQKAQLSMCTGYTDWGN